MVQVESLEEHMTKEKCRLKGKKYSFFVQVEALEEHRSKVGILGLVMPLARDRLTKLMWARLY